MTYYDLSPQEIAARLAKMPDESAAEFLNALAWEYKQMLIKKKAPCEVCPIGYRPSWTEQEEQASLIHLRNVHGVKVWIGEEMT